MRGACGEVCEACIDALVRGPHGDDLQLILPFKLSRHQPVPAACWRGTLVATAQVATADTNESMIKSSLLLLV